ncbi:hypothetical protein GFPCMMHI_03375 [Ensifer adhaerens]|nr:hypothetical protein [Ensifer adhaerens]
MIRPMTDFLPYNRYEHFIARGRAAPAVPLPREQSNLQRKVRSMRG